MTHTDEELALIYQSRDTSQIIRARFKGLPWADIAKTSEVTLGGIGGIGSWLALYLARAGCYTTGYDFDTIETHNFGGQLYPLGTEGQLKTDQAGWVIDTFCGEGFKLFEPMGEFVEDSYISEVAIAAFDSIPARQLMYKAWLKYIKTLNKEDRKKALFVDGRMGSEFFQLRFVKGDAKKSTLKLYEKSFEGFEHLKDGGNAEPCTQRATSHVGSGIAVEIMGVLANHWSNQNKEQLIERPIPFYIERNYVLGTFEIKYTEYE